MIADVLALRTSASYFVGQALLAIPKPPPTQGAYETMRRIRATLVLLLSLSFGGCSAAAGGAAGGGSPDLITREQIEQQSFSTALEVVQRLRPQWLRVRAAPSFGGPAPIMVYMDNVHYGTADELRSISAQNIERLEWVDATTATQRWGTGNAGGAIAIVTRRGG